MKQRPIPSELAGFDLPQRPLPWEPSERRKLRRFPDGAMWKIIKHTMDNELPDVRPELVEYFDWLDEQYIFPGEVGKIIRDVMVQENPLGPSLYTSQTQAEYYEMMRQFEQDHLGLVPSNSSDGLHWWESSAGFASAHYPTDVVAKLAGMDGEQLLAYIQENKHPIGWIVLKSDDYLIPVTNAGELKERVIVSEVQELTPVGKEVLKKILFAYEKGLQANR